MWLLKNHVRTCVSCSDDDDDDDDEEERKAMLALIRMKKKVMNPLALAGSLLPLLSIGLPGASLIAVLVSGSCELCTWRRVSVDVGFRLAA